MEAIRRQRKKQEIMFNIDATYQAGAAGVWLNFSRPSPLKIIRPTEIRKFTAPPAIFYTDDFLAAPNRGQNRNGTIVGLAFIGETYLLLLNQLR